MHTNIFSTTCILHFYFVNNVAVFPLRTICFLFIRCGLTSDCELRTGNRSDLFYKNVNNLGNSFVDIVYTLMSSCSDEGVPFLQSSTSPLIKIQSRPRSEVRMPSDLENLSSRRSLYLVTSCNNYTLVREINNIPWLEFHRSSSNCGHCDQVILLCHLWNRCL